MAANNNNKKKLSDALSQKFRNQTALFLWMTENKEKLKKDHPNAELKDLMEIANKEWEAVEDKSKWQQAAVKLEERHKKQLQPYKHDGGAKLGQLVGKVVNALARDGVDKQVLAASSTTFSVVVDTVVTSMEESGADPAVCAVVPIYAEGVLQTFMSALIGALPPDGGPAQTRNKLTGARKNGVASSRKKSSSRRTTASSTRNARSAKKRTATNDKSARRGKSTAAKKKKK